jgi:hypothetical protein
MLLRNLRTHVILAVTVAAAASHAPGQVQPSAGVEEAALQSGDEKGVGMTREDGGAADDPLRIFRAPLLREGSSLVEAVARLNRSQEQDWWVLDVQPHDGSLPTYSLVVLPCTRLAEMVRIRESAAADAAFQVSGRVLVFRGRNYFLPSHAAVVSAPPAPAATGPTATSPAEEAAPARDGAQPGAAPSTQPGGAGSASQPSTAVDSAEAIMRELEMQSGPIARSSGIAQRTPQDAAVEARTPADAAAMPQASAALMNAIQENTAVINRRGKVTRDRAGGWLLVFDADAAGLADPPMKLLPCMLLESIEDYARRVGNNSPVIVTGQIYLYNGQNYLLPTVYRIPRESTRLTP